MFTLSLSADIQTYSGAVAYVSWTKCYH